AGRRMRFSRWRVAFPWRPAFSRARGGTSVSHALRDDLPRTRRDLIKQPPLLFKKGHLGIEHRFGQAEVEIGRRASLAAARSPHDELAAQQVRLDLVSQG